MLPQLKDTPSKMKKLIVGSGIGVNNGYPPFEIPAKYLSDEKNLDSREYPIIHVRPPRSSFADSLTLTQYGLSKRDNDYITAVEGTEWKRWTGSAWSLITNLTASAKASQVNYDTQTLLANGTDMVYWDGASGTGTIPTAPAMDALAVNGERVFGANSDNDILYISALGKWNDWTTADDSGEIQVLTEDGETNNGLVAYGDHIIYFKPNSCHELFGKSPDNFTFQTLSDIIGCVAKRTILEVQGTLFFLGSEGVYEYNGGATPRLVSYPKVDGWMKRIDWDNITEACAGTDGDRYYLTLPIDSNDRITITYDVRTGAWHNEDDIVFVEYVNFDQELYAMQANGQILKIDGDDGESISWYGITKKLLNDYPSNRQSVRNIYVIYELPTGSTMKCAISTKEGAYTDVKTFDNTVSPTLDVKRVIVPLSVAQDTPWYQIKFYGTGACKIHRFEIQSRIRGTSYNRG